MKKLTIALALAAPPALAITPAELERTTWADHSFLIYCVVVLIVGGILGIIAGWMK